jgi:hypothetical protein
MNNEKENNVIANCEAVKQSRKNTKHRSGLLRRCAPRNDEQKISRKDRMLVEKIIILDWLATPNPAGFVAALLAMTNKTENKHVITSEAKQSRFVSYVLSGLTSLSSAALRLLRANALAMTNKMIKK